MVDQAKNIMIGIFVIVACSLVIFMLMFLHPSVGDEGQIVKVRFSDIDKVTPGTRVTFGGNPVGEVLSINEIDEVKHARKGRDGRVYSYELELIIDSGVMIYNTDEVLLRTSGLLGEKTVSINPLPSEPGEPLRVVNNEVIFASETGTVEETFKEIKQLSDKFEEALDSLIGTLTEAKDQNLIKKIGSSFQNISEITDAINKPEELSEIVLNMSDASANLSDLTANALDSWDVIDDSLMNMQETFSNTNEMMTTGRDVVEMIGKGEGTMGRIIVKDDIYLRFNSILSKGETILDDVNHYGILFHNDKGWKRLRARRMNLLQKLCTPQEFRNYFNDEINQISTSLSRVSNIMDHIYHCCPCYPVIENEEFKKVYAELLRRVDSVEEALEMYNQQLMDEEVKKTELVVKER